MPHARVALAQMTREWATSPATRRPCSTWTRKAADAGADLVVFPEMMLTGYPIEDLALRASFRRGAEARPAATATALADAGLGDLRGARRHGRRAVRRARCTSRAHPRGRAGRRTRRCCCSTARVAGALQQAPPAQLRRLRRVPDLRARRRRAGHRRPRPAASACVHLRGHLAGRRAGLADGRGRGLACWWCSTRRRTRRARAHQRVELARPARARGRGARGVREPRRRPGRPRVRRRLVRDRARTGAC